MRRFLLLVALASLAPAAPAGTDDGTKSCIVRTGDLDGDARDDLLIASRDREAEIVWLVSGGSGRVIREFRGRSERYGCALAAGRDADQDALPDLWIAARGTQERRYTGKPAGRIVCEPSIELRSGRSGALLRTYSPGEIDTCRRISIAVGDLDGDCVPDLLAGFGCARSSSTWAWSGSTGQSIFAFTYDQNEPTSGVTGEALGCAVAIVQEAREGAPARIAVGNPGSGRTLTTPRHRAGEGSVDLYTVVGGVPVLERRAFVGKGWNFGSNLALSGDSVQLGQLDLLVVTYSRSVSKLSGRDLTLLYEAPSAYAGQFENDDFGASLDAVPDLNADGVPEYIVGADEACEVAFDLGYAFLVSGRDGSPMRELFRSEHEGVDVACASKIDADDVADLALVIHCRTRHCKGAGDRLRLISGKDFSLIREVNLAALRRGTESKSK